MIFMAGARDACVSGASLPVPAVEDSVSAPAPLIIPGRPAAPDTARRPQALAREKVKLGESLERSRDYGPAIAAYQSALKLDPTLAGIHYRVGRLYLTRDEVGEAARHFSAEVERHPDQLDAHRELGLALARMGDSTRAIARLEQLTRGVPSVDRNWSALGFAYSVAGRPDEAERALRKAIALPPVRSAEQRDLGVLMAARGRVAEARAAYERALVLDRKDATVWLTLGNLARRVGGGPQALAAYRSAAAADSAFMPALKGQIAVLRDLGRGAEAGQGYRRWLHREPADYTTRLEAVQHFSSIGRGDIALELARDGVRHDRRSADGQLLLGMALATSGQLRASLTALQRAEAAFREPAARQQVRGLIETLRREAPDSLRALFAEDSAAHATRDTTRRRGR